ncbi:transporter substrate-binding domain-containing protein [Wenzhouxiangella sp. XN79A]|uniref:transglycosylase SLT domain-containing protein n=1 Tax=Wenzhouxiangella sp. XN79A TaxID=2724193 RepID=UPI00144ACDD6|nr:transporter substrate-binding domain-containing protein [Wenzhouxiangella sp. XN79A]NKI34702.1 transporter substrate-binding domain-containing protein [Wenzhouxiangella sp. XN79A]
MRDATMICRALQQGLAATLLMLACAAMVPERSWAEEAEPLTAPYTGDLDAMAERGVIRVGSTFSRTNFFLDAGVPRGMVWEAVETFERQLRARGGAFADLRVVIVPLARDALFDALAGGQVDLLAANLSITPERSAQVAFSAPLATGIRELVVTGPSGPVLTSLDELAGQPVHVRASSSYRESLERMQREFRERGLAPPEIVAVDELLETEDILELVAAGVYPATIADSSLTGLWREVLPALVVHDDLVLRDDVAIAWAMRPDAVALKTAVDAFVREHRRGTLFGNVIIRRYLQDNPWVRNPLSGADRTRFDELSALFRHYAERYEIDWLLSAAQGYQESRFDQSLVSPVGAVGIMQLLPTTAADPVVGIPEIENEEQNIHAGIKYKNVLLKRYFDEPELDPLERWSFALAAYNAGPSRIRQYRQRAAEMGLDRNRWFRNVELVSNRETRTYVANIFKYYLSYREYQRRVEALKTVRPDGG